MAEAPTEASALLVPDAPASAEAPAPHDDEADDRFLFFLVTTVFSKHVMQYSTLSFTGVWAFPW